MLYLNPRDRNGQDEEWERDYMYCIGRVLLGGHCNEKRAELANMRTTILCKWPMRSSNLAKLTKGRQNRKSESEQRREQSVTGVLG